MKRHSDSLRLPRRAHGRSATLAAVCFFTMAAAQAAPVTIPDAPLETGAQYPSPNVYFILDDSGSMGREYMPDDLGNDGDLVLNHFQANPLWYNPHQTYNAWIKADKTRDTQGTSITTAYEDLFKGPATTTTTRSTLIDLTSVDATNGGTTYDDTNDDRLHFYFPKDPETTATLNTQMYRFEVRDVAGTDRIVRSEWLAATTGAGPVPAGFPRTNINDNANTAANHFSTIAVPENVTQMVVSLSGPGTHGTNSPSYNNNTGNGADLRVDDDSNWNSSPLCSSNGNGNVESCTINNPAAGTWWAGIIRDSRYAGVTMTVTLTVVTNNGVAGAGCDSLSGNAWRNCTFAVPDIRNPTNTSVQVTDRSAAAEMTNLATWFSYHRTRAKIAKAGAAEAFASLGRNFRVGYNSIHNVNKFDIPVSTEDGVFQNSDGTTNANRTAFYDHLFAATDNGFTPLRSALLRAGQYYQNTDDTGPWGSGAGQEQISCRQSFTILTTDGYWNERATNSSNDDDDYYLANRLGHIDSVVGPEITGPLPGDSTRERTYQYEPEHPYCDNNTFANPNQACNTGSNDNKADTLADVAMYFWNRDLHPDAVNNVATSADDEAFWQHMVTFGVSIGLQGSLNPAADRSALDSGIKGWPNPMDAEDFHRIDDLWHASINGRGSFVAATNPQAFQRGLLEAFSQVAQRQGSASNVTSNSTSFSDDTLLFQASYTTGQWIGELKAFTASASGLEEEPEWLASEQLPAWNVREFYTWNGTAGADWPTPTQASQLNQSTRLNGPVSATDNVRYIKGVTELERRFNDATPPNGDLRNRASLLGDIINSSPFYVGDTRTVYVGANDGMMHAFNADTGVELFAYIPGGVNHVALGSVSDPYYTHKYFVDGPIAVSSRRLTPNQNILVGSLGRGGKWIYGLNVTNPGSFAATDVLWERTDAQDMGYVLGEPLLTTLQNGDKVAIIGNGLNSTNESAVLFIVNLTSGAMTKINTGATGGNGLMAPRGADLDLDGDVDAVYAADYLGNLWKFDFSDSTPSLDMKLYDGEDGQHVTSGLALARDPATSRTWVFFGTGSFITPDDPDDDTVQAVVGIMDHDVASTLTQADLREREITVVTDVDDRTVRGFEPTGALDPDEKGWFVELDDPDDGERVVTRPQVIGTALFFVSRVPPVDNTCDAGGTGYLNALSAFSGTSTNDPFFDVDGDGAFDEDDYIEDAEGNQVPVGSLGIESMPTAGVFVDTDVFYGTTGASTGNEDFNAPTAQRKRAAWSEIIPD